MVGSVIMDERKVARKNSSITRVGSNSPAMGEKVTVTSLTKEYLSKHKGYIALYIVALLMHPVKELVLPHLYGQIVKAIQDQENVMLLFTLVIVVWVIVQAITTVIDWTDVHYYPAMMDFLRNKVIMHVLNLHRENFDDLKTFETISKQNKLPILIYGFLDMWKKTFIPMIVLFIFAFGYMAWLDKWAGIVLALVTIIIVLLVIASPFDCEVVSQGKDVAYNALNEETEDVLRNLMAVLNAVNEDKEEENLHRFHMVYTRLCQATMSCAIGVQARMLPIQVAFMTYMVWRAYKQGQKDVGKGVTMLLIVLSLSGGLTRIFNETRDLIIKWGMVRESMTLFNNTQVVEPTCPQPLPGHSEDQPQILIKNVTLIYRDALQPVLDDITIAIPENQRVLIMGRIGSGKSTLLKLIMRYKRPKTGEIFLRGIPYCQSKASDVRRRIGYVPQLPMLFNRSIYKNIVYGSEASGITIEQVEELIRNLGLESMFDNLEQGLMSLAGKNGSKLSGGQRQVVWILRVLLQEPEILLLDEPTASIDVETKDTIYALLTKLMHGRTVVMVTHDDYLLQHCDRVIELGDRGTILSDAPPTHKTAWLQS